MDNERTLGARLRQAWTVLTGNEPLREEGRRRRPRGAKLLTRNPHHESPLLEAGGDPDDDLDYDQGGSAYYRGASVARRDLRPADQDEMIKRAALLYINDPTAARIIERRTSFILGEGFSVVAEEEEVQDVLDAFTNSPHNRVDRKAHGWVNAWRAYGELALRFVPNRAAPEDGAEEGQAIGPPSVAFISPDAIKAVETVEGNCEEPVAIHLKDTGGTKGPVYKVIRAGDRVLSDGTQLLDGEVLYVKANALPDMSRGVSDLWRLADLIEGHSALVWDLVERSGLLNTFLAIVTKKGATEPELEEAQEDYGREVPRGGRLIVKNEEEEWDFLTPSFASNDAAKLSDLVLALIANGVDFPLFWLNGTMDPNKASAEQMTGPTLKGLAELQREMVAWLEDLLTYVVHYAVAQGHVKEGANLSFSIEVPEISTRDLQGGAATLLQVVNATAAAVNEGLLDEETSQRLIILVLDRLGVSVTLDELREKLEAEGEEDEDPYAALLRLLPPPEMGPPEPDGGPNGTGLSPDAPQTGPAGFSPPGEGAGEDGLPGMGTDVLAALTASHGTVRTPERPMVEEARAAIVAERTAAALGRLLEERGIPLTVLGDPLPSGPPVTIEDLHLQEPPSLTEANAKAEARGRAAAEGARRARRRNGVRRRR